MSQPDLFSKFEFNERILAAIANLGFEHATPIQAQAIPPLLEGRDVIGRARTGSGKTAAFGLPLLQRMCGRDPKTRGIVLCPTRELALQVTEALRSYSKGLQGVRIATIYGGSPYPPQIKALKSGVSIVVGTPGRVLDHLKRGTLKLDAIEAVVLDEADEMLRMGFIEDVRTVLDGVPETRQVMLFSATMPTAIRSIAKEHLSDPLTIQVEREALSVGHIKQYGIVIPHRQKVEALRRVLAGVVTGPTLVFSRTRLGCADTAAELAKQGIAVDALHGNLTQAARERVLDRFRARGLEIVIATDVAARGLDVNHITHVINYDIPHDVESYVHRIGRTGRAGREGTAISFITPRERRQFRRMHNTLRADIDVMHVPTDAKIARHRQNRLLTELADSLNDDLTDASTWVTKIARDTGLRFQEIAAAAVTVLAKERGATLERLPDEPLSSVKKEPLPNDEPSHKKRHLKHGTKPGKRSKPRGGIAKPKRSGKKRNPNKGMRRSRRAAK